MKEERRATDASRMAMQITITSLESQLASSHAELESLTNKFAAVKRAQSLATDSGIAFGGEGTDTSRSSMVLAELEAEKQETEKQLRSQSEARLAAEKR
jgi:hypothetical protein